MNTNLLHDIKHIAEVTAQARDSLTKLSDAVDMLYMTLLKGGTDGEEEGKEENCNKEKEN